MQTSACSYKQFRRCLNRVDVAAVYCCYQRASRIPGRPERFFAGEVRHELSVQSRDKPSADSAVR